MEENDRLLRQLATAVLGPADSDGRRKEAQGLVGKHEHLTVLLIGPVVNEDGLRDANQGLVAKHHHIQTSLQEHVKLDERFHYEAQAYQKVFSKKLSRIWRVFKWGSDDMVVALQAELRGEPLVEEELTETGQHKALQIMDELMDELPSPHNVQVKRPTVDGTYHHHKKRDDD